MNCGNCGGTPDGKACPFRCALGFEPGDGLAPEMECKLGNFAGARCVPQHCNDLPAIAFMADPQGLWPKMLINSSSPSQIDEFKNPYRFYENV